MFNQQNKFIIQVIILLGFIFLLSACDGRPKGVLSQSKMADILVEMHKTDAYLAEKGLSNGQYSNKAPYYNFILKKYGISQAQFDSSLVWYTINPQRFENVYDNVISQLTDSQNDIDNGKYHKIDSTEIGKARFDLWNKGTKYVFTKDSVRTRLDFEIKNDNLLFGDRYILKMLLFIAHEDSCKNRHIVLRINYFNGKTDSMYQMAHNDGLTRRYTFRMPAHRKLKIKSITGQLLGSSVYKGIFHATVDSIKLIREFKPANRDSLQKIVQKADTTNYKRTLKPDFPKGTKPEMKILKNGQILKPV